MEGDPQEFWAMDCHRSRIKPVNLTEPFEALLETESRREPVSPFIPVTDRLESIKDGTIAAALIDEIIRLRAIVAQSEKP